jgi:hypothetical protein
MSFQSKNQPSRIMLRTCALLICACAAGCSSTIPQRTSRATIESAASEVVFESQAVRDARDTQFALSDVGTPAWRDASLSIRAPESAYDQAAWAAPRRPRLDRPGRVHLRSQSDSYIYFRAEGYRFQSDRAWWSAP